jgi:hypothetical protein
VRSRLISFVVVVTAVAVTASGFGSSRLAGGLIVFESTRGGNPDIYVMNPDGSGVRQLTQDPAQDSTPFWAPTGKRIYFASDRSGRWQLYRMNTDGTGQTPLKTNAVTAFAPHPSRDGKLIAFESFDARGRSTVQVASAAGGTARNLTPSGFEDLAPSWGANDSTLVVARGKPGGSYRLYSISVVTGVGKQLTAPPAGASDFEPDWSPSGKSIAFTRLDATGNYDIYSMPASPRAKARRLTQDPAEDGGAAWSPDESALVFRSARSGSYELWKMNADGTGQVSLTGGSKGVDVAADWAAPLGQASTRAPQATARSSGFYCVTPAGHAPPTQYHDVITGTPYADYLCGLGGPDSIHGLDGNDMISGGSGNDRPPAMGILAGDGGDDIIFAIAKSAPIGDCDYVDGGASLDTAWVDRSPVPCSSTTSAADVWVNVSVVRPP